MAKDHLVVDVGFSEWLNTVTESIRASCAMPDEPLKLFDYRGCYISSTTGMMMFPYPGGIFSETKPTEGQIHIEWGCDGYPKFVHKYKNGVGNGWVDITATYAREDIVKVYNDTGFIFDEDKCECGNPKNPIGQGHSDWCKLFKQEF